MTHWNYRLIDFDGFIKVCVVHYDEEQKPIGYVPAVIMGGDKKDLIDTMDLMTLAFEKEILKAW